jgi:aminoglycoside phosphotransferase (APT) family kinase protein
VIAGGRSNLTYRLDFPAPAEPARLVLRRPPLGHVLPTAHDMAREYRVISALRPTATPVPATVLLCEDPAVLGVTFYVMERIRGHTVRDRLPAAWPDTAETRQAMSRVLMETLSELHSVEPQSVGLSDFGRPAGYLERQLRRWWQQWEASKTEELPEIEELRRRLEAGLPAAQPPGIVHGDYRLDNTMFSLDDPSRIVAVLDWEMSTLGDPLADLGLLLVYWADSSDPPDLIGGMALPTLTMQSGFMTREELVAAYAARSQRALGSLPWYVCLGYYKLAIIAQGIHARFRMGMTVGQGFDQMGGRVPAMVRWALERATASGIPGLAGSA